MAYHRNVQRISAILLLAVFSFSLSVPAILADSNSTLPACCRRDGKHHCAMMDMQDQQSSSSGAGFHAAQQKCPYFPKAGAEQAHSKILPPRVSAAIFASILSHPAAQAQTEAQYRTSFSRARQKRGPPLFFS